MLQVIKKSDPRLLVDMANHYSQPKGFVGRSICYAIIVNDIYYGSIVGGSATLHLRGRNAFFNYPDLNQIVNNIFFHVNRPYPMRNFVTKILDEFCSLIAIEWYNKYGDTVLGFETIVEPPRTGEAYIRNGWSLVGETVGYECKRGSGYEVGKYSGKRYWNRKVKNPKLVFCKYR